MDAGMSFTMARDIARLPSSSGELRILRERLEELANHAERLFPEGHILGFVGAALMGMAEKIDVPGLERQKVRHTADYDRPKPEISKKPAHKHHAVVGHAVGKHMHLSFDTGRCIHARFCVLGAPKVFLSGVKGQWLFPDEMETNALRAVCQDCPSGAIQYIPKGDTAPEAPPPVNIVNIREDGPYGFRAPLEIGGEMIGFRATLCRCGASNNKPFCDGSHKGIGFRATGEPETRKSEALEVRDGPLEIQPPKNGPLQVTGNLEICAGTNRNVDRVTSVRLCRCGGSKTKPFCDNTHLKIGFKSD